jgi:general secretion pathway protein G
MVKRSHALAFIALSMSLLGCVDQRITRAKERITRAKESVLRNNLFTIRTVIDEYTYDKQKAPQGLQDLVSEGYLRKIPEDPITGSADTWKPIMEDMRNAVNKKEPGLLNVRSGSDKKSLDGSRYADW